MNREQRRQHNRQRTAAIRQAFKARGARLIARYEDVPVSDVFGLQIHCAVRRTVNYTEVEHDDGCPCEMGDRPMTACTCERVNVTILQIPPAPEEAA